MPCRSRSPRSASCSCRSASGWRSRRRRRSPRSVATSPGARSGGVNRWACSPSSPWSSASCPALFTLTDGAWYAPRASLDRGRRGPAAAGARRWVTTACCTSAIPGSSRSRRTTSATASRWRSSTTRGTDSRDRWPVADGTADDALRDAVRQLAADGTRRGGRLLAPFGIRFVVVPVIDGAASTASDTLPLPGGLVEALGAQLDLVRSHTPPSYVRFENRSALPVTAQLSGPLAEASNGDVGRRAGRRRHVDGDAGVPDGRRRPGRPPATSPPASSRWPRRDASNWELTVGGAAVPSRDAFGVATAYDVGHGWTGHAALRPAGVAHHVARRARPCCGSSRSSPPAGLSIPTRLRHAAGRRGGADRPRRRAGRQPA